MYIIIDNFFNYTFFLSFYFISYSVWEVNDGWFGSVWDKLLQHQPTARTDILNVRTEIFRRPSWRWMIIIPITSVRYTNKHTMEIIPDRKIMSKANIIFISKRYIFVFSITISYVPRNQDVPYISKPLSHWLWTEKLFSSFQVMEL